jgi:hypothetical protein
MSFMSSISILYHFISLKVLICLKVLLNKLLISTIQKLESNCQICFLGDHPFKMSACLRGEGCPHVPIVKRSQYIRMIKNPLHKHFAGMPMIVGVKNCENLPTSKMDGP